jgi:GT2 family glycosyltransferase
MIRKKFNLTAEAFILSYKAFDNTTFKCLESLLPQTLAEGIPLQIADNNSPDDSGQLLKEFFYRFDSGNPDQKHLFRVHFFDQNYGFAGGMNQITKGAQSDWLILIGSDTLFPEGSISNFLHTLERVTPNIGLVGPVTNQAGTAQKLFFKSQCSNEIISEWHSEYSAKTQWLTHLYRADFFCIAIRTSLWNTLGGLDERYGRGYFEDFDFCMRAKTLGNEIVIAEDVFVYHQGSATFKIEPEVKSLIKRNKSFFLQNHPEAELRHIREDTFKTFLTAIKKINKESISPAQFNRLNNRYELFVKEEPKSLHKKLIWFFRCIYLNIRLRFINKNFR